MDEVFSGMEKPQVAVPSFSWRTMLMLALWFALVSGLMGATSICVRLGNWNWKFDPCLGILNSYWVTPTVDVVLFLVVGFLLVPVLRWLPRWPWPMLAVGVFSTMAFFEQIALPGRLQVRGAAMLALGLGTVAGRWMKRNPARGLAFFRRTIVPVMVVAAFVAVLGAAAQGIWERIQVSRLPAAAPNAPNVLLVVMDTVRADRSSAYGYARPTTPFLEEYARRSVLFDKAFATSSWTLPSHVSFFTGRFPYEHGGELERYDGRFPPLARALGEHGYATVGVSANAMYTTCLQGVGSCFQHYESMYMTAWDSLKRSSIFFILGLKYLTSFFPVDLSEHFVPAAEVNQRFLRWLDGRPDRPFFAFLNYMDAHHPYDPPAEFLRKFSDPPVLVGEREWVRMLTKRPVDPASPKRLSDSYDAALAYLDAQLRALFAELRRRGLEENTLVVILSDHGESLGEHGNYSHRTSLYLEQIRVPLVVHFPGKTPEGMRVGTQVGLQNVPATIAEFTGLGPQAFPGISLSAYWSGTDPEEGTTLSELYGGPWPGVPPDAPIYQGWVKSLVSNRWHFIWQQNGKEFLFDWPSDPQETRNLLDDPQWKGVVADFRARMQQFGAVHSGGAP